MSSPIRDLTGIVALVFSGFFFYTADILAFVSEPAGGRKFLMVGIFLVPAFLCLWLGSYLRGFHKALRDVGIVLLVAAGTGALVVLSVVCIWASPAMQKILAASGLTSFSDLYSGGAGLLLYGLTGYSLFMLSWYRR